MNSGDCVGFDECTILKLCNLQIPKAYRTFFGSDTIMLRNHDIVLEFRSRLDASGIKRCKFVPDNLEYNSVKVINDYLMENRINVRMFENLREQLLEQIDENAKNICSEFQDIPKRTEIVSIQRDFQDNIRQLRKIPKIPEDDDCMIISGFISFAFQGDKYLVSEDEHFWGYGELIKQKYNIVTIRERECLTYTQS
jgi:hypothetical protein